MVMAVSIQDKFVSNFHSLNGTTIAEQRKSLFLLLDKTRQCLETTKDEIDFSSIAPRTPLEENFKVDALIYFRKSSQLLDILKSENPVLINRILKGDSWFVKEAFGKINGKELTTEIFPCLSYNTKLKLLNKFSNHLNDERKCDEYFQMIMKNYGVNLASKLLPGCSAALIMNCIESNRVEIPPRHLLMIIKKFPSLTEGIFEKLHQRHDSKINFGKKYKFVFVYLVKNDVELFVKLNDIYKSEIKLGSRATSRFIYRQKQEVIQNPLRFYSMLKKKRIGSALQGDFTEFYKNVFPKTLDRLDRNMKDHWILLHFMACDAQKLKMLLATFRATHGSELWDHEIFMTPQLIEMMSPNDREVWLDTYTRPKEIPEERWISFMKTEKSIPLLKEKIALTSKLQQRATLVNCLAYTCKINNDKKGLLDVCRYMAENHLNDHLMVRRSFMTSLLNSLDLTRLEDEHWNYINRLMYVFKVNNETCDIYGSILERFICYCMERNRPIEDYLEQLVKTNKNGFYWFNIYQKNPKCEKHCLLMFNEIIPRAYEGDQLDLQFVRYLSSLFWWNERHPEDQISLFLNDHAINSLAMLIRNGENNYRTRFMAEKCLLSNFQRCEDLNVSNTFFKHCNQREVLERLIRNHPLFVLNHTDAIIENFVKVKFVQKFFRNLPRLYTHLKMPQKMSEACLNIIKKKDGDSAKKRTAAIILSYLTNAKEFLSLAEAHCPMEGKNTVLPCLKNIISPSLVPEWILSYCKESNYRFVQNFISSRVSEERFTEYLKILNNRAMSFKKPRVFLDLRALKTTEIRSVLDEFIEKNYQVMFKSALGFFVKNPSNSSWKLVQQCLKDFVTTIEKNIAVLTNCKQIPLEYFAEYVLCTWEILENSASNDLIEKGKCNLLDSITPTTVAILSEEFSLGLIQKYLFKINRLTNFQKKIHIFTCQSIIYASTPPKQENHLKFTLKILKDYVQSTWNDVDSGIIGRKMIKNFVKEFCAAFLIEKGPSKEILRSFITSWNDVLKPHDALNEHLYLQFSWLCIDCLNDGKLVLAKVGEKLAVLCDALNEQKCFSVGIFCEIFSSFWKLFYYVGSEDNLAENRLVMIENMIKTSDSSCCLALAVSLLPVDVLMSPEVKFKEIVLKRIDPVVQMRLHHCFETMNEVELI